MNQRLLSEQAHRIVTYILHYLSDKSSVGVITDQEYEDLDSITKRQNLESTTDISSLSTEIKTLVVFPPLINARGMQVHRYPYTQESFILRCLETAKVAMGYFVVYDSCFYKGFHSFEENLNKLGYYIDWILGLPDDFYATTSINLQIMKVTKFKPKQVKIDRLANVYIQHTYKYIEQEDFAYALDSLVDFAGVEEFMLKKEIEQIRSQYKDELKVRKLGELCDIFSLNSFEGDIEDSDIIIPSHVRTSEHVLSKYKYLRQKKSKHVRYFLLRPRDRDQLSPTYLRQVLGSKIGLKSLQLLAKGQVIPRISGNDLPKLEILCLNSVSNQSRVVDLINKLDFVKNNISIYEQKITDNPAFALDTANNVEGLYKAISESTPEELVLDLIKRRENIEIEFKINCIDRPKPKPGEYSLVDAICKTICAFTNTRGGVILVGVHDKTYEITDDLAESFSSDDDIYKHFANIVRSRLSGYDGLIEYEIYYIQNKKVLKIDCKKSKNHKFYNEQFYIRKPASNVKLTPEQYSQYTQSN